MVAKAAILLAIKLSLGGLMITFGAVALGGASTIDDNPEGGDSSSDEEPFEALEGMGWWVMEIQEGIMVAPDVEFTEDDPVVLAIGLNGIAISAEPSDAYACFDWSDDDTDWGEFFEDNCPDLEDFDGWDDFDDEVQSAVEALCTCRAAGGALKAFAIIPLVLIAIMAVFDTLHLLLECCKVDLIACIPAKFFFFLQLVLAILSFICILAAMALAAFGCPIQDEDTAKGVAEVMTLQFAEIYIEDHDDVELEIRLGGAGFMLIFAFLFHIAYLVLACCMPKKGSTPATPKPAGTPMQPAQPVTATNLGPKFDPTTGAPIPKFNSDTGKQNW